MGTLKDKYDDLVTRIRATDGALVAFSGGVDSTFLAAAAVEALGDRVLAVTGRSPSVPLRELRSAAELAKQLGVRHRFVDTTEFADPTFAANPPDRCYHCKSILFRTLQGIAEEEGLAVVIEGSNTDDLGDYRPGSRATRELGVRAPMAEADLAKEDIRALSKEMGVPTWSKPAMACLASRVPYGEDLTPERMRRIDRAEEALFDRGFTQVRVRDHGEVARIEVPPEDIPRLAEPEARADLVGAIKDAGYLYVAVDLEGYRTGAMNEGLS